MLKTLYQIGKAFQENEEYQSFFKPWQNPLGHIQNGSVIIFQIEDRKLIRVSTIQEYKTTMLGKYLYRDPAGSRGTNLTPSSKYYHSIKEEEQEDNLKKFYGRLERTLNNNKTLFSNYIDIDNFWMSSKLLFEERIKEISEQGNVLVTFTFDGNYPGEIKEIKELLFSEAYDKYKKTKKAEYIGKNQVCAVTHKKVEEVWGKIGMLGFTVDDEAFIRGGFDGKQAWKMFPVDKEIVPLLEGATELIFNKFQNNFYKLSYLVVPRFINWPEELIQEATNKLINREASRNLDAQINGIIHNENYIYEIINDEQLQMAGISYDFFFYQKNQNQLAIKAHFTDVMPSRLREIGEVKEFVNRYYSPLINIVIPKKGKKAEETIQINLSFSNLKNFFASIIKRDTVFNSSFYQIIEAVFYRQKISKRMLFTAFMNCIRIDFKNYTDKPFQFTGNVEQSFAYYIYFQQLNIIHNLNPITMSDEFIVLNREEFVKQHEDYLKPPLIRAAFNAGFLVEKLLEAQRKHISSEPFRKNLLNLQIDPKRLKDILVRWEQKVQEYMRMKDYEYLGMFDELKAETMALLTIKESVDKTEFSYAFTLGMVMQKAFAKKAWRKKEAEKKAAKANQN